MSTTTVTESPRTGDRALAVSLGLVSPTPPPLHLPPLTRQLVPGRSPLEASGWAEKLDATQAVARR